MDKLYELATRVTGSFVPAAERHHNFFVNDIPADLQVYGNAEHIASVISGMLSVIVSQVSNSCIRLSAVLHGSVVVLEIEQAVTAASYMRSFEWQQVQQIASGIGGVLHISSGPLSSSKLSFSFPQSRLVA